MNGRFTDKARTVVERFDEAVILAVFARMKADEYAVEGMDDSVVVEALRRIRTDLEDASVEEIREAIGHLDDAQLAGLASNVKGVAHELLYAELENADGDGVSAGLFDDTNHPTFDAQLTDEVSGEQLPVQLKATDDPEYIRQWLSENPDGQILVTEELAQKMGLTSSGVSNEELTEQVDEDLDRLAEDPGMFGAAPEVIALSGGIVLVGLSKRKLRGELDWRSFRNRSVLVIGVKTVKIIGLCALLQVPIVGQVTAAGLTARLVWTIRRALVGP